MQKAGRSSGTAAERPSNQFKDRPVAVDPGVARGEDDEAIE
jgi:hypothetical protein